MSFDARPLTAPVDPAAVRAHAEVMRRATGSPWNAGRIGTVIAFAVIAMIVLPIFFVMCLAIAVGLASQIGWGALLIVAVPVLAVVGIVIAIAVGIMSSSRGTRDRRYRLDAFARANHLRYLPRISSPPLPGMIFGRGSGRRATDVLRGDRPRFVEFGNYRYSTGSGRNRSTHRWGYVAVKLDVPLPHIVLDATSNNGLFGSNLPMSYRKEQHLSLEGDFDRYFSLFCPAGYEADALYLFTPDIMARFIDNAAALDVEIVDDWLFFYAKRQFVTLDPATWAWLFGAVGAMLDKLAQWERWRDDRLRHAAQASPNPTPTGAPTELSAPHPPAMDAVAGAGAFDAPASPEPVTARAATPFEAPPGLLRPPPGVAPPGRRLSTGVRRSTIILIGIIVGWWALTWVLPLLIAG
ncbi:hypothetical protein [Microbacterium aquimaris]|uniref:DUF3137 domain-containing protein n=1 Tax=Microbacterium aquimaris TaxID=459816 RepID=A0ABU5N3R6_9MICO|nr:hypothetical protein [Microbacterium aquimaris]MDZ8160724.1 hypothetical protein [Microbacterium aquimaris]